MTTDTLTKCLLAAIALGLWLNLLTPWIRPPAASAGSSVGIELSTIRSYLYGIHEGTCPNSKIC